MRVGLVGLGTMDGQMARRLLAAGHMLHVYDPAVAGVDGATAHDSPAVVTAEAEVVLSSVPMSADVEEVYLGPLEVVQFGGIIANDQPHIHISLWDRAERYYGGHLHENSAILTLSEISIRRCPDLRLTRRPDAKGVWLLDEEQAE